MLFWERGSPAVWPRSAFLKDREAFDGTALPAVRTVPLPRQMPRVTVATGTWALERDCRLRKPRGELQPRFELLVCAVGLTGDASR